MKKKLALWILLPIELVSSFILWDYWRLENNFKSLFAMLNKARYDAWYRNVQVIVRFNDSEVVSSNNLGEIHGGEVNDHRQSRWLEL